VAAEGLSQLARKRSRLYIQRSPSASPKACFQSELSKLRTCFLARSHLAEPLAEAVAVKGVAGYRKAA